MADRVSVTIRIADHNGHYGACPLGTCGLDRDPVQASLPLFD